MKLLVDQNLPLSVAVHIISAGHDVIHTSQIGLERATDPEVFEACRELGRTLITADKKLTKFLASERATSPSVVILRDFRTYLDAAASVAAALGTIERTVAENGPAVFSLAPAKPLRVELLPLGAVDPDDAPAMPGTSAP
jgi:predicted nuclease of predicted toxin-antitoxin system